MRRAIRNPEPTSRETRNAGLLALPGDFHQTDEAVMLENLVNYLPSEEKHVITLQNKFKYQGDINQSPFLTIKLSVLFPMFDYARSEADQGDVSRKLISADSHEVDHELSLATYRISAPASDLIGAKNEAITNFLIFSVKAVRARNISDLSFTIPVRFTAGTAAAGGCTLQATYFIKNMSGLFDAIRVYTHNQVGPDPTEAASFLEKNIFLINQEVYKKILPEFNQFINRNDDWSLLSIIQRFVEEADLDPTSVVKLNDASCTALIKILEQENIERRNEVVRFFDKVITDLFDFPILVPAIKSLALAGVFEVKTPENAPIGKADLLFYDLSLAYSEGDLDQPAKAQIVHYDWNSNNNPVKDNRIPFVFSGTGVIILSNVRGPITVSVKAFDGTLLWVKEYQPDDPALKEVLIVVSQLRPVTLKPAITIGTTNTGKKLRGQVLELTKKCSLKDITVVVQAKKEGDELWRVVSAGNTDASGNFSMPYPYGAYTQAQAIVSPTPDSPADIPIINSGNSLETIADDFLYLMITNPECTGSCKDEGNDKECDCNAPKKAGRLPDQADLINSDEYTQDIGGSCVNLSTPNRTLSEFNYQGIVRTSDPDVANYTLKKITPVPNGLGIIGPILGLGNTSPIETRFELVGGAEMIIRKPVGLTNPIQWQDAPDNKENLTVYQAVTIATGHILHFKAVTKADGYSLGNLLYSLALAPGQKKQIVVFDSSHTLRAAEAQQITQVDSLAAGIEADRGIDTLLGGSLNEFMQGRSSTNTSGISAGLGIGVSLGIVGGALGVAGGTSNANSSATQNSSRNASQYFGEKLRQSVLQSASDFRQINASVVTTVQENQKYAATTEVVANHNHCHALTMMYFEVLRHFAIYQELANVEECVFVPLLMTNFSVENIYKWADVLASHLLPMPSNTYLQPFSWVRQHPLLKAFDANERIKTNYVNVDFPAGRYCDENISSVSGTMTFRTDIPRPKTRFDRILSLPIIRKTVTTQGGVDVQGTIRDNIKSSVLAAATGGISLLFGGGPSVSYTTETHDVLTRGQIFDLFMTLDENYETVPPSQCIRVHNFDPITIFVNGISKTIDFFDGMSEDKQLWSSYASVLKIPLLELLNKFSGNVIGDWDKVFYDDIAPLIIKKLINDSAIIPLPIGNLDLTNTNKYTGREQLLKYNFTASTTKTRADILHIDFLYNFDSAIGLSERATLIAKVTLNIESITINYSTAHYNGRIFSGYVGNDLLDTVLLAPVVSIPTPLNFDEKRDPRKEDIFVVTKLIEHLNSNLEYYNKVLWYKLDVDRRFMLLDGFGIQVFDDFGLPIPGSRSLASVVKNELITVVGNSLVFPVAAGYRVGKSYIQETNQADEAEPVTLLDHYKPLTPVPPYRISIPSRGVFVEAVQGACDACEREKEKSSQDWIKFTTDEPTSIAPLVTPVPTITDWKAAWKDFAPPLINIQNAPAAPAPGAGLAGLNELLGKSGVFKDITGLDANQQNVIRTYLSNQENARAFAEMAKSVAVQDHNTAHSNQIMDTLKTAKDSGAVNQQEYGQLVKDHIQKQIDGGDAQARQEAQASKKLETSPIKSAVELAQSGNNDVSATESDSQGNSKSLEIKSKGASSQKYNFTVPGAIEPIKQPTPNACWATVTTMMSNWKKQLDQSVNDYIQSIGAEYIPFIKSGITIERLGDFCGAAGLKMAYTNTEYPVSFYYDVLQKNGPIWVIDLENADPKMLHGRLLVGIKGDDSSDATMFTIIDPATGSKYDEDLPTFVSKTENVVRTLDAVKDVQIPLLIYYKDSYETSKFSDTPKSGATIGTGGTSGSPLIHAPSISTAIANFKSTFSTNPKILTSGQFHIRDLVFNEISNAVNADLTAKPDSELQAIWNGMLAVVDGFKSKNLINKINGRGIAVDYPNIVKVYAPDPTATKAWAQALYKQFWLNDTINVSPNVNPATVARSDAAYDLGGIDLNGRPTGEKGACFSSTHALGRKYIKARGLGPIPANLKISQGQIAGVKTPLREGVLDRIVYSSPEALKKVVDDIKAALNAGYPVVCGLLSGATHDTIEFPKPEHFILVFAYENNVFAFWDSDVSVSNMTATGWGPGFGILVATRDTFSTGWDAADLSAVDTDMHSDTWGDHLHFPRRHRYQVYSVQTLPL